MKTLASIVSPRWLAPTGFLLLLGAYHLIFREFFPTRNGTLGDDYSQVLPRLLDGYYWLKSSGLSPFWFTPAFCGGLPALGTPDSGFYSVPQLFTLLANPLASVYATVLLFASLGFWGFYLLLRACFASSRQTAVLAGALFMFNGFFIHRMMIGHFAFHGVMLTPWIAYFLLRPTAERMTTTLLNGAAAGCLAAYGVYSGMVHLLLPVTLAVLGIVGIYALVRGDALRPTRRALAATFVAVGLSAAKLTAGVLYLHHFPRSDYDLPGITGFWSALRLLMSALFLSPPDLAEQAQPLEAGMQWNLDRHEWEYGISVIPLAVVLLGIGPIFSRIRTFRPRLDAPKLIWLAVMALVITLPLALNIYTLDWNDFLKTIPLIKSSSNLLRWFVVYIPLVILSTSLLWDGVYESDSRRSGILVCALAGLILINATTDRSYYQSQSYQPDTIVAAWANVRAGILRGRIQSIGGTLSDDHRILRRLMGDDVLALGQSQIGCNNPIFGYRLERYPLESLHPGPILAEQDGVLNIKNPACYLYPTENSCRPGDHFTAAQISEARAFADYKPFAFRFSRTQNIANAVTLITIAMLALLVLATMARAFTSRIRAQPHS